VRLALADASPLLLNALRFALAALVLAPWLTPSVSRASRGTVLRGLLLGVVLAAAFGAQSAGMLTVTAGRSAFLTTSYVLITPLLAYVALGRRPRPAVAAGALLALAGIGVMTGPWRGGAGPTLGDALTLAGALLFAVQILVLDVALRKNDRVRALLLLQLLACGALSAIAVPIAGSPRLTLTPAFAGALAFLSLVASAGALALQAYGQRRVDPSRAALIVASEPVWAALIALPFGETMTRLEIAGAALVLAGVLAGSPRARAAQAGAMTPR
jgi:drug/metabolite transporter (DMT)-like permease